MAYSMESLTTLMTEFNNSKKPQTKKDIKKVISEPVSEISEFDDKLSTQHGLYQEKGGMDKFYGKIPESATDLIDVNTPKKDYCSVKSSSVDVTKPVSKPVVQGTQNKKVKCTACNDGIQRSGTYVLSGFWKDDLISKGYPASINLKQFEGLNPKVKKYYSMQTIQCPECGGAGYQIK